MEESPLISVVTVTYNAVSSIESTIKSVLSQSYSNIEYIIIDGISRDGTLDIIHKYRSNIDIIISEKDDGIYDAMNKGFKIANGDFIIFMNAGDLFASEKVLEYAVQFITEKDSVYYGNVFFKNQSHKLTFYGNQFDWKRLIRENICHQSILYPKSLFKNSYYKLKYKILADWEYNIRHFKSHKFQHIPIMVSIYDTNGISSQCKDYVLSKDKQCIIKKYWGFYCFLYYVNLKFKKRIFYLWNRIKRDL